MNTPLEWVRSMVPGLTEDVQEYMDAMTLSGTKAEGCHQLDKHLSLIKVGQIISIAPHPDADKLIVCQVNIGEAAPIQIVTGAKNVKKMDKIPVVLVGGSVAGGHDGSVEENGIKIKKGKLRGVESFGMMCSIEELGSSREFYKEAPEDGIYIFEDIVEVGSDAVEVLGLHDAVVEYEVTSNRVDCFSIIGIAREAAATFRKEFKAPVVTFTGNDSSVEDLISVTIKDAELCPRYVARAVKNVKIKPSPKWMQRRLSASGIRPINNLVDITNYVMLEYGQPMHAYDLTKIENQEIIVKRAKNEETFITLDGVKRTLDESILMICDGEKPIGIAGIMGGENSMITEEVTTVLFEAACFIGTNIRLSSKKIGLRTDASSIFEKGLDPNNAIDAINRACQLVEELGAGEVVGGTIDKYPCPKEPIRLPFEGEKYNKILGTTIPLEEMLNYFHAIGLIYEKDTNELIVPTYRQDVLSYADLAEEVARFFGYDNIPTSLPTGEATTGKLPFKLRIEGIAKDVAELYGFSQGMCYSFESPKVFDKLLLSLESKEREAVTIMNPLGEDFSIMRTVSLNGMLTSLSTNYNRRNKNVRLYELGNIYLPKQLPVVELPEERMQFTMGMYGDGDFFSLKGVIEEFCLKAGLLEKLTLDPNSQKVFLHPGRQANLVYQGEVIGYMGEVHPQVTANYSIKERVYVAVIDMQIITEKATFDKKYQGLAKFPAANRDLSMVVPKTVFAGNVETVFEEKGGQYLESYELFDLYEGSQILDGYKSMAYKLSFRAKDKNLEENDMTTAMNRILKGLEAIGVELRK